MGIVDGIGYIAYSLLILLALIWTFGVRVKQNAQTGTIISAIYFIISAIFIGISGVNKIHSIWIIPLGYLIPLIVLFTFIHLSSIYNFFKFIANCFSFIVRIGTPPSNITYRKNNYQRNDCFQSSKDDENFTNE